MQRCACPGGAHERAQTGRVREGEREREGGGSGRERHRKTKEGGERETTQLTNVVQEDVGEVEVSSETRWFG